MTVGQLWMVRWKTGLHKAFDGTVMEKAGEWRYHIIDDGWREGARHLDAAKPFTSRLEAESAMKSVINDAKKGNRVCTWYNEPDRKDPIVEVIEVSPRYINVIDGYEERLSSESLSSIGYRSAS
jgi:hypothetical protein